MKKILIITNSNDIHAIRVSDALKRFDAQVSWFTLDNGNWSQPYRLESVISGEMNSSLVSDTDKVWYRKPDFKRSNTPAWIAGYVENENRAFLQGLQETSTARWIHSPSVLQISSNKLSQLSAATSHGLVIPETLVTNERKSVKQFYARHGGRVIAKGLGPQLIEKDGRHALGLRTTRVKSEDLEDQNLLDVPIILQKEVERTHEIRTVMMGDRTFSFGIRPKAGSLKSDIKLHKLQELEHFVTSLSEDAERGLRSLARSYGLEFCSADFLVTENGREVFLELNPNGQWMWLEEITGVPLTTEFANFLCS